MACKRKKYDTLPLDRDYNEKDCEDFFKSDSKDIFASMELKILKEKFSFLNDTEKELLELVSQGYNLREAGKKMGYKGNASACIVYHKMIRKIKNYLDIQ